MSEIIWDLALIQKYNQSGPRYTSYPTALEFNESYTNEDTQTKILLRRLIVIRKDHFPFTYTFRFVTNFVTFVAVIR